MCTRTSYLLISLVAAGVAIPSLTLTLGSGKAHAPLKLEGAWVGITPGVGRTAWVFSAGDSSGRRASCIVHASVIEPAFLASLRIDSVGDFPAELLMTGPNSGTVSEVAYTSAEGQVVWIAVIQGTFELTDASHIQLDQCTALYQAATDSDGDGLPDPGSSPVMTIPMTTYGTRIAAPAPCAE